VSTEWIVLVCSIKCVVTITKYFTYSQSDRQVDDIFEGGNTVYMKMYRLYSKMSLQKMIEITEI